jgi:uncharacterized membrane protein YeiB
MTEKTRLQYLDVARGLAMFIVVSADSTPFTK